MKLSTQAYCKMVLHGAKYPHCAVNGLLVAEKQQQPHHSRGRERDPLPPASAGASHALFVDCIPLFHGTLALTPMLEVALTLGPLYLGAESWQLDFFFEREKRFAPHPRCFVSLYFILTSCHPGLKEAHKIDSWCKENSYVIAGYYQANERLKDASPNQVAEKVASRIAEGYSDPALIMVDNTKFTMECIVPAVHVYEHHENKWRCKDPHL